MSFESGNYEYYILNKNEVALKKCKPSSTYIFIPESASFMSQQYNVTRINENAFLKCIYVIDIIIPSSVKDIDEAFEVSNSCLRLLICF